MIGIHALEHPGWIQASLNTGLVITGNDPIHAAASSADEVFELLFAAAGDVAFLLIASAIRALVAHRMLQTDHLAPDAATTPAHRTP